MSTARLLAERFNRLVNSLLQREEAKSNGQPERFLPLVLNGISTSFREKIEPI